MSFFTDRISSYGYQLLHHITGKKITTIKKYFQRNEMSVLKHYDFKYYLEISYNAKIEKEKYKILGDIFSLDIGDVEEYFISNRLDVNKTNDVLKFKKRFKKLL